jgi:Dyp-type peroxidase family
VPASAFVITGDPAPGSEWMAEGSFMVFRKLEQNVAAFEAFVKDQARQLGMDEALLAARMMGRWKSGAPLALAPLADDAAMGADPTRNDDFDHANDPFQRRCPYGAHTRKTNPRAEPNLAGGVGNQRIMRQGIPYGAEASDDPAGTRGLLFVCYQSDIASQFEKQQHDWANDPDFPPAKPRPQQRPGQVRPGLDPIIGQPRSGAPAPSIYAPAGMPQEPAVGMDEPIPNYPTGINGSALPAGAAQTYVTARATLYLFAPSKTAMAMHFAE